MKNILTIAFIFFLSWLSTEKIYSSLTPQIENSEPYILLTVDKQAINKGEEVDFVITYGNRGPQLAKNIKITFNQPLDGRAPLEFISADPEPDKWFITEFGNLAEFIIGELQTFEATEEGRIEITAKVRKSVARQILTPSANLQAPNKERGERLITSSSLTIEIGDKDEETIEESIDSESTSSSPTVDTIDEDDFVGSSDSAISNNAITSDENELLNTQAPWSTLAFLSISLLLILAFIAGRKSKIS